jgi:hypothetical protein
MFATVRLQEHLKLLADASAARGPRLVSSHAAVPSVMWAPGGRSRGQDDWLMSGVVDVYGTSVHTEPPVQLAFALDGLRSATRDKGWLFSDNAADPRLMGWTALSRGARGLTFSDQGSPDGDRVRAAGALAGIVTRNPALFAPLRPRASKVAILYDPRAADADFAANTMPRLYRALFARNIQVDFIHLDEVADGAASRYRIVFRGSVSVLNQRAWDALNAYVKAGGTLVSAPGKSLTDARILELVTEAGAGPDVRLNGAHGVVETRFLESSDVIMLIGLNHGDLPQRVTLAFEPDTQEAIWQNMETGSAVNFVAGPEGPTYTYLFGPRSSLVLMIRKSIR